LFYRACKVQRKCKPITIALHILACTTSQNPDAKITATLAEDSLLGSYALDPIKVLIYGNVTIVMTGDTEKAVIKEKMRVGDSVSKRIRSKTHGAGFFCLPHIFPGRKE